MKRDYLLPDGCSDLNKRIRVVGQDGKQIGVLTAFEATNVAKAQAAKLIAVAPSAKPPIYRIVDTERIPRKRKERRKGSDK